VFLERSSRTTQRGLGTGPRARPAERGPPPQQPPRRTEAEPAARPRLCSSSARCLWKENGARQALSLPCSGASRARCPRSANSLQRGTLPLAKSWAGVRRRACAAASSAGLAGSARSALRQLTRRACLSAVSAANEASCATARKPEQHSAVAAQRRPPSRRAAAHPPTALLAPPLPFAETSIHPSHHRRPTRTNAVSIAADRTKPRWSH